ncbi:hypothetical protein [Flavobacterium sp.]|uniref:hypothetical protein n=1 Tax=Flavobacterium sp. TaxID=239 RepID=UPI0022CA0AC8|nr:hypothetical protein [Flavobacterium sp.]MCZ8089223.1 hypothetical protein [Flavobacterium sp.]
MINCNYVGGENIDETLRFVNIINEKNGDRGIRLTSIQQRVLNRYDFYLNHFEEIENMENSIFSIQETDYKNDLKHCYKVGTNTFRIIRGEIFNSQSNQLKAYCPYCLLNTPTTLDHYIGQTEFPEFSVLIKNLIPCCYVCNKKKDDIWRNNNRRRYIHFYNDNFLNNRFLYANLEFNNSDVPNINFELIKPPNLTDYEFEIISWHFEDLDLRNKYIERSNAILSSEIQIILHSYERGNTIDTIREVVRDKYIYTTGFGLNYWQNCLYETISNNIENIININ